MRQNDIFKNFNLPRWATPIIYGFLLLGSAGDFAMKFLRATQRSSDPTRTADPRRDPIPQIQPGIPPAGGPWDPPPNRSRPYRCSRTDILMSGCCDTRYCWDRYDNSGSRQAAAEEGSFAGVGTYVMTSIRKLCLYRIYDLCVKPQMCSFTKNVYF